MFRFKCCFLNMLLEDVTYENPRQHFYNILFFATRKLGLEVGFYFRHWLICQLCVYNQLVVRSISLTDWRWRKKYHAEHISVLLSLQQLNVVTHTLALLTFFWLCRLLYSEHPMMCLRMGFSAGSCDWIRGVPSSVCTPGKSPTDISRSLLLQLWPI